jgi:hypothetical protein
MRNTLRGAPYQHIYDITSKIGNMMVLSFDIYDMVTTRAWVHKLDTYFHLNLMKKEEEVNFSTLHLLGEAHEWWYHGILTLGHENITSYEYFT